MYTQEIQNLIRRGDFYSAVEAIHTNAAPLEIAARYASLVRDLYWKAHDLNAVVAIGRAGIIFCLGQSLALPDLAEKFRSIVKGLAYDLGSFTWPGWEEPGIAPTADQLAVGRECARLNLRLAIELHKPPDRVSMAHWLVGAHALACGRFEEAQRDFQSAVDVISGGTAKGLGSCNLGYLMLARLGKDDADGEARGRYAEILDEFSKNGDDESKTYLTQLMSAQKLFVPNVQ